MQCFMKKEHTSLIDVEHVEPSARLKALPSELTNTIEHFIVYVHRNEAHSPTCMYIIPMYLWVTTFTKTVPKLCFAICISLWGSTHDSDDCWSAHRSPAARDSFKRVHDRCKAGWRHSGAPAPPKKILESPVCVDATLCFTGTRWVPV